MKTSSITFATLLSAFSLVPAEVIRDSIESFDHMTVTATRTERRSIETPNSIDILTADQIQLTQLSRSVPDALSHTTGVMIQKTGLGMGSPYLRGFTGQQTLFLIDGIRLNNSVYRSGPNQYWNTVDLFSLDRMEIIKGPGSVLYGSDAIGGTVNTITAVPKNGRNRYLSPRLFYRYSSAEQSQVCRIEASTGLPNKVTLSGGVSPKKFGDLTAGGDVGVQKKTGYDELDGDARLDVSLSEKDHLLLSYQQVALDDVWRTHSTRFAKSWMGTITGSDQVRTFDQNRNLAYLVYKGSDKLGFAENVTLRTSHQRQFEEEYRVKKDTSSSRQGFTVNTLGAGGQIDSRQPFGLLSVGVDVYRDYVGSFRNDYAVNGDLKATYIQGPVADDATYDDIGAFIQDDYSIGRFNFIAGLRYSHFIVHAANVLNPVTKEHMRIDNNWNSFVGSFRTMVRTMDNNRLNIFAGIGQGFRAPNLSDLTRFDIAEGNEFETPAPNVEPEQFVNGEVGLKSDLKIIGGTLAYYYTDIAKMIIRTPTGATIGDGSDIKYEVTKRNSGDGYVQGFETSLWARMFEQIMLEGGLSFMTGEIDAYLTSSPVKTRDPLSRLMPTTGHFSLGWKPSALPLRFNFSGVAAMSQNMLSANDKKDIQRIPPDGSPSYFSIDFGAEWQPVRGITVSAILANISNEEYRIHGSGLNEAGRSVNVGVNFKY